MPKRRVIKRGGKRRRRRKQRKAEQQAPRRVDKCLVPWAGDMVAAGMVKEFVLKTGCKAVVETGTYKGATTKWFASLGLPVHTIEKNPEFLSVARARLAGVPGTTVYEGSSDAVLPLILPLVPRPTLFFLDAHWEDYWPLKDELRLIAESGMTDARLIIHDCAVPGRGDLQANIAKDVTLDFEMISADVGAIYQGPYHVSYNDGSPPNSPGIVFVEPPP